MKCLKIPILIAFAMSGFISLAVAAEEQESQGASVDERIAALEKAMAELRSAYEGRIATLESEIRTLKTRQEITETLAEASPPPASPPPSPAPSAAAQGSSMTSNYFNPSISVIGNFLGVAGSNDVEELPSMDLRESEVGFRAVVDPYASADVFLSFPEEGVEVEEGYVTLTSLPARLLAKIGRMRAMFGKINTLHLHALPWPDEPLPIVNLLGGDEGWIGTGVSVSEMIPMGNVFSELTLEAFRGDAEDLFEAPSRGDLSYNAHYRVFHDLTDSTNIDFGLSYGFGPNGVTETSDTTLQGVDITWRWKPLQTARYRSAIVRAGYIRSRREQLPQTETSNGWFFSGEYQLARRWFVGGRFEIADRAYDSSIHDSGEAATVTFWPTEFMQLRTEFRRRLYAEGETANEILFQVQFALGAHGAHPF